MRIRSGKKIKLTILDCRGGFLLSANSNMWEIDQINCCWRRVWFARFSIQSYNANVECVRTRYFPPASPPGTPPILSLLFSLNCCVASPLELSYVCINLQYRSSFLDWADLESKVWSFLSALKELPKKNLLVIFGARLKFCAVSYVGDPLSNFILSSPTSNLFMHLLGSGYHLEPL